ncbi:NAD-dependent epimerase/dehydratase family protein [Patescibacteria group bacterium]|nr:NAD-dependent epimerase/dehydratase family protein [Patescibacteria group bacterium]
MPVFLTGATGFIGSKILQELLTRKYEVRVFVRRTSNLESLKKFNINICYGDITDKASVEKAAQGCDFIIHSAALYSLWLPQKDSIYQANLKGTRNILETALKLNIKKIVYTSTVATVSPPENKAQSDENSYWDLKEIKHDYTKSKYLAEQEALKFYHSYKLPIVIVNPTIVVGPGDARPTPSGDLILNFLKGKIFAYFEGGGNFVDVHDVARWHVDALEKGRVGQRYILGNENLSLLDFFKILAKISDTELPIVKIPAGLALIYADLSELFARHITKTSPVFTKEGVRTMKNKVYCDCKKTHQEFGPPQVSIKESLKSAVTWFKNNNYL